jgi:CheY-like chemotaxis protein
VDAIRASGSTLLGILGDVLDFSKIEAGQLELESAPFSPAEALAALRPMLATMSAQKGLRLHLELDPALPAGVLGDRRALHQVVLNLAGNAVKFTTRGFVAVRAQVVATSAERCRLRLEVEDSGIGIAEEAQRRIFTEFTQADGSITRRFGGTGLGLAICRRLVELQGGSIGVRSRPGEGSTFWCELEYPRAAPVPRASPRPHTDLRPPGLRVLVVEDVELNRSIVGTLLEDEGHTVRFAADGYGALELHEREDFDTILLDIHLPDLDGMEVARRIRRHPDACKAGCASSHSPPRSPPTRSSVTARQAWIRSSASPSTSTSCCAASTYTLRQRSRPPRRRTPWWTPWSTRGCWQPTSPVSVANACGR